MSREFTLSEHGFMEHALNQAKLAMTNLEVPVGCVFVEDGKIIASGSNRTNETRNATRHAEMEAVDFLLEQWQKDGLSKIDIAERFSRCALYVTCEPCIMCAAALSILGIREVVYGCANDKFGGCGSILSLHESSSEHLSSFSPGKGFTCCGGLMASEAIDLFRCFYEQGNPNARIFCYARLLGALFSDTIRVRIYERRRPRPMKEPKRCVDNINGRGHLLELQLEKS